MTRADQEKQSVVGKRISLLFVLIFAALAVLIFRLSFLQLSEGRQFLSKAEDNRYVTQSIPAPRGLIYDRNKTVLVRNKSAFEVTYQPLSTDDATLKRVVAQLAPVVKLKPADLLKKMDVNGDKMPLAVDRKIVTNATPEEVAYVREHGDELPGFNVVVVPVRDYVYGALASHVIGYLNDIPKDYYNAHKDEYQPTDKTGWAGVEKQYESYLHGKDGKNRVEVNINYQPLDQVQTQDPVRGDDLVLTIDKHLQEATQNALAAQVQNLHKSVPTVVNGAAIALNPKTGEVLAMASYPSYDPNMWIKGLTDAEYQNVFAPAEMNRAIQQLYLPGSVIKMSSVLIGLKEGAITPNTVFYDPGYIDFGNTRIRSWAALGAVDAYSALAKSSNVYMIQTFERVGHYDENMPASQVEHYLSTTLPQAMNKIINYQKEFGLGPQKTGIDLPYEETGSVSQEGLASDLAFTSFGQTENYTLMQVAQYTATLANNGTRMKPYVVSDILGPDGSDKKTQPTVVNKVDFTSDELKVVQQGMYDVTHKSYGTFASVFQNYPIPVAGKSGTAETGRGTENDVFVGYAPYNDPQIAIAIILPDNELNSHSSSTLGSVAKAMMDAYFKLDQKQK